MRVKGVKFEAYPHPRQHRHPPPERASGFLENATVRRRDWYKLLDAPVLTLDVTV